MIFYLLKIVYQNPTVYCFVELSHERAWETINQSVAELLTVGCRRLGTIFWPGVLRFWNMVGFRGRGTFFFWVGGWQAEPLKPLGFNHMDIPFWVPVSSYSCIFLLDNPKKLGYLTNFKLCLRGRRMMTLYFINAYKLLLTSFSYHKSIELCTSIDSNTNDFYQL